MNLNDVISSTGLTQMDFVRVLLFLLFFILIFVALRKVPSLRANRVVVVIVSLIISLFAARYISEEMISRYILSQYTMLGLIFLVGGPFIILFFIANGTNMGGAGRKILWGVYGIMYAVVWFDRFRGGLGNGRVILIIGAALIIFMIVFDKAVAKYFRWRKRRKDMKRARI